MSLSPELLHRLRHNPDAELAGTEHQSTIIALLDEIDLLTAERDAPQRKLDAIAPLCQPPVGGDIVEVEDGLLLMSKRLDAIRAIVEGEI